MNKKILIVEDDIPVLQVLEDALVREGFTIIKAKDGEEGLKLYLNERPDLILLDIIMPVMDGMTMLRKLREETDDWGKTVPVILLTNLDDAEDIKKASESGVKTYLVKANIKLEEVVGKVRKELNLEGK